MRGGKRRKVRKWRGARGRLFGVAFFLLFSSSMIELENISEGTKKVSSVKTLEKKKKRQNQQQSKLSPRRLSPLFPELKMVSHLASLSSVGPTIGEQGKRGPGTRRRGGSNGKPKCLFLFEGPLPRRASIAPSTPRPRPPPLSHAHNLQHPHQPLQPCHSGLLRPRGPVRLRPAQDLQPPHARVDPVVRARLEAPRRSQASVDGARWCPGNERGLRPGEARGLKRVGREERE
jgi:hypothetical protein